MEYEAVIGLEVHVQLGTASKIFCCCSTEFGAPPNTHTCPVCQGMPGVLPVLNKRVVEFAIKAALALNCEVNPLSVFARKNYFYPDLPKGYQISQYELPLAEHGHLEIETPQGRRCIGITRIHMEEDAGKNVHGEFGDPHSYIDMNRTGVPLMEIVSEPDIRTPEEARLYLQKLRTIMRYLGVSDAEMEKGELRCDANISIRPKGEEVFGIKTELKNMNSFKHVQKALEYEIRRQQRILEKGERIVQETLLWNPQLGVTETMRSKEEAHDYRYFPDPDLVPLEVGEKWLEEIKRTLPELPDEKKTRFISLYALPAHDAEILTSAKEMADFFEEAVKAYSSNPKAIANWVMVELMGHLNAENKGIQDSPVSPQQIGQLVALVEKGTISGKMAKEVFAKTYETGKSPERVVEEEGLVQLTDEAELEVIVERVLEENPDEVGKYLSGKKKVIGYFVGQVMRATKGRANPQVVNRLLSERLGKRKGC